MNKRVLIIADTEGFIIKGMEMKLKARGVAALYASPMVDEVEEKSKETDLFVIYADDDVGNMIDALDYVKDYCSEKNKRVIVIGTKADYETLQIFIPNNYVYKFFKRPFDMEKLLDEIEKYMRLI